MSVMVPEKLGQLEKHLDDCIFEICTAFRRAENDSITVKS